MASGNSYLDSGLYIRYGNRETGRLHCDGHHRGACLCGHGCAVLEAYFFALLVPALEMDLVGIHLVLIPTISQYWERQEIPEKGDIK